MPAPSLIDGAVIQIQRLSNRGFDPRQVPALRQVLQGLYDAAAAGRPAAPAPAVVVEPAPAPAN